MKLSEKILEVFGLERDADGMFTAENCRVTFKITGDKAVVTVTFAEGSNLEITVDAAESPSPPRPPGSLH